MLVLRFNFSYSLRQISVDKVAMKCAEEREQQISQAAELADIFLRTRADTVIMTSRELISGKS